MMQFVLFLFTYVSPFVASFSFFCIVSIFSFVVLINVDIFSFERFDLETIFIASLYESIAVYPASTSDLRSLKLSAKMAS